MQFGIQHPNFSYDGEGTKTIDTLSTLARTAESLGFDSFWVMDHFHQIAFVGSQAEPMLEGWTTISVLAGMTSKIKLGTLVTGNSYRYPSIVAKMGATLDVLSKGRLFLGIGAAWNDLEARAYGITFPPTGERLARLEESVQIIRKMWTEDEVTFDGKYYKLEKALCNPKPIQKPTPKILIGGSGEKVTLKIVAKYGDACNLFGSAETVKHKLAALRKHCEEVGRDYDSILKTKLAQVMIGEDEAQIKGTVSQMEKGMPPGMLREMVIYGTPDQVQKQVTELADAGIQYLIMGFSGPNELQSLRLFGETVLPKC
jgi:F420-dependent oxidoreductase-like protein